jgi:hypothetical protein
MVSGSICWDCASPLASCWPAAAGLEFSLLLLLLLLSLLPGAAAAAATGPDVLHATVSGSVAVHEAADCSVDAFRLADTRMT